MNVTHASNENDIALINSLITQSINNFLEGKMCFDFEGNIIMQTPKSHNFRLYLIKLQSSGVGIKFPVNCGTHTRHFE